MQALTFENDNLKIKEPFKGLFTQGLVSRNLQRFSEKLVKSRRGSHNKWKKIFKKDNTKKIIVGPQINVKIKKEYNRPR